MSDMETKIEDAIKDLIFLCGDDPAREGVVKTPARVIKAFKEQTVGYQADPADILATSFNEKHDEMIVLKDIEFTSLCEHHLLPFFGSATVGYIPNGGIVGISKIARLVDCFAKRFQVQERMTTQIAEAMSTHLKAHGVGVIIQAKHQCMRCRGVQKQNSVMVTSVMLGLLKTDPKARAEFLSFK